MQKKVKPHGVPKLGSYNSLDKTWWGCLIVFPLFQSVITNITPVLDIILLLIQIVGKA